MIMTGKDLKNDYNPLDCCNEEISDAMTLYKNGDSEGAITKFKKALRLAKIRKDLPSQIVICQILGTCQRLSKDDNAAWVTFVEGWNLIETFDREIIVSDMTFMFYAYEMLRVESNVKEKRDYYNRFNKLWGKRWEAEVFNLTNV